VPNDNHKAESWSLHDKETGFITYIIWMQGFDWTIDDQQTLVHEIYHTASRILIDRGVKFEDEKQEAYAYYFDWLFGELWNKLKFLHDKMKRKNKR
jgi:hypothetical protein